MSSKRIVVDFFYDVISPYSWISFELLCRYRPQWQSMSLKCKPFLLGGIMSGSENKPPATIPSKLRYMDKDIKRLNRVHQIPIVIPENFFEIAFNKTSLKAQRFLTAIDIITKGQSTEVVSRELWKRMFVSHQDITLPDSFREAARNGNIDEEVVEKAIIAMEQKETKDALRKTTEEALSYGAFGAPTSVIHLPTGPELVFGCDRMEVIASLLGEKYAGPLLKYNKL